MNADDRDKMMFEWLKAENELVNKQISSWSEADQKIMPIMVTVVVALIGLSSSAFINETSNIAAYMLLLAAIPIALAVIQSSLYSSLILLALERKVELSKRTGAFLSADSDFVLTLYKQPETIPFKSYKLGVIPYLLFRSTASLILSLAGLYYLKSEYFSYKYALCLTISFIFSLTALMVTVNHVLALFAYHRTLGDRPGAPKPKAASEAIEAWKDWFFDAPCFPNARKNKD